MSAVDTIAAIATPPGRGGIGIVRVSGPATQHIAQNILSSPSPPYRASYRTFKNAYGEVIDSGVALLYEGPRSFTGEDVLELHGHGGRVVLGMLLRRVLELGARAALPGEFSLRAFMNEKIDLAQTEALADLIDSQTEAAARSAQRSLQGAFSKRVREMGSAISELRKWIEAGIDFPEEDIDLSVAPHIQQQIQSITTLLSVTLQHAREGVLLKEGVTLVISGRPNVGKSSLLNRLTGQDTAIVTEIPGTTRDLLREHISLDGLPVHVVDTAGLRSTENPVEREGIERAWRAVKNADLTLLVLDDQSGFTVEDKSIYNELPSGDKTIIVRNKIDLTGAEPSIDVTQFGTEITASAMTGAGLSLLHQELKKAVGYSQTEEPVYMARHRHITALKLAAENVEKATEGVAHGNGVELIAEDLRLAQNALSEITGEFSNEDLLTLIFSDFCIGK